MPKLKTDHNLFGRVCTTCAEFKPWDEFYVRPDRATGRDSRCCQCHRSKMRTGWTPEQRAKYAVTKEYKLANYHKNREANPEKYRTLSKMYYERHKARTLHQNWVRQIAALGCTPDLYHELLTKQKGVCAICGKENQGGRRLAVDHDHESNVVRGLLCNLCNTGIGALGDTPEHLRKALEYLCQVQR